MQTNIRVRFLGVVIGLLFLSLVAGWPAKATPLQSSVPGKTALRIPMRTVTGWPTYTPSPTPTATRMPTPTPTPTSHPGRPTLLAPDDGELMPQPVRPATWYFAWGARNGPCNTTITITGPDRGIHQTLYHYPYEYIYSTTVAIPDTALGPWTWQVSVWCPAGSNVSDVRTFFVQPAPVATVYLPVILRGPP